MELRSGLTLVLPGTSLERDTNVHGTLWRLRVVLIREPKVKSAINYPTEGFYEGGRR